MIASIDRIRRAFFTFFTFSPFCIIKRADWGSFLAISVFSLYKNLGGVKFGMTADGQPGYKKDGADTVIPFKGTPEYIATVELVYSGEPSQRHNLTVSAAMAKYKTLIISCTGNVGGRDTDTVEISSGNGKVLSVQKISELMVAIVENASINTVISFVHYGTGLATAIVYGL